MITTTTRLYSHEDSSAPVLTGAVGSPISLLKTILVGTGGVAYGSKAALGWTLAFEDVGNNVAVFRNSTTLGNGCYLRVADTSAAYAEIAVYEAMTDVNTGIRPANTGVRYILKAPSGQTRPWFLVGDQRTFYLQTIYNGITGVANTLGTGVGILAAGDYIRLDGRPGIMCNARINNSSTSGDFFNIIGLGGSSTSIGVSRHSGNLITPVNCRFIGTGTISGSPNAGDITIYNPSYTLWTQNILAAFDQPLSVLGYMRGVWHPMTNPVSQNEILGQKIRPYAGTQFEELILFGSLSANTAGGVGICGIETTRSWDV